MKIYRFFSLITSLCILTISLGCSQAEESNFGVVNRFDFNMTRDRAGRLLPRISPIGFRYMMYGQADYSQPTLVLSRFMNKQGIQVRSPWLVSIRFKVSQAGEYKITLKGLITDPVNEGGRGMSVYVANRPLPAVVLNSRHFKQDYSFCVLVNKDDIKDGWLELHLTDGKAQAAYVSAVTLYGPLGAGKSSRQVIRFSDSRTMRNRVCIRTPQANERFEQWNLGIKGFGMGTLIGRGYANFSLPISKEGEYIFRFAQVTLPRGVSGKIPVFDIILGSPSYNGKRIRVLADQLQGRNIDVPIKVTPGILQNHQLPVTIIGRTFKPVYIEGLDILGLKSAVQCHAKNQLALWVANPFDKFNSYSVPKNWQSRNQISINAVRGEYETAAVVIGDYRSKKQKLTAKLRISPLINTKSGKAILPDKFDLKVLTNISDRFGNPVWEALLPYKSQVEVPNDYCRLIWLTMMPITNCAPGNYKGNIDVSLSDGTVKKIPVNLTLHKMKLDRKLCPDSFVWDTPRRRMDLKDSNAITEDEKQIKAKWEDFNSHYISCLWVPVRGIGTWRFDDNGKLIGKFQGGVNEKFDIKGVIEGAKKYKMKLIISWDMQAGPAYQTLACYAGGPKLKLGSKAWKKAFECLVKNIAKYLISEGFKYDDFIFYFFDEYAGPNLTTVAKELKAANTKIQIICNRMPSAEQFEQLKNYIDIWCPPNWSPISPAAKPMFDKMRHHSKQIWQYGEGMAQRGSDPFEYRKLSWQAYKYGLAGNCWWIY